MHLDDFLQTDRASVEIGARLIPLVDPRRGNGLLDRIGGLRRDLARKNGLWVPPIRLRDNIQLEADAYRILIGGREVARGQLAPGAAAGHRAGQAHVTLEGEATKDPAFGLPARWIAENDRHAPSWAATPSSMRRACSSRTWARSSASTPTSCSAARTSRRWSTRCARRTPSVVDELMPNVLTMGALHRVLCLLLEEHVPISNLTRILESLAHHAPATKDPVDLTERVRVDLGRVICDRYRDAQGRLHAIVVDPRLEMELRRMPHDKTLVLDPGRLEKTDCVFAQRMAKGVARGQEIALLTDASLRRPLRHALVRGLPDLAVIAYQEVPGDLLLEPAAMLRPEDLGGTRPLAA